MTQVTNWQSNILYPGGQGKCGVGTADLFPDRDWFVNVSIKDLHKWMWNLEEWSSDLSVTLDDTQSSDGESISLDLSMGGKNHYSYVIAEEGPNQYDATGRILLNPPNKRFCGDYFETELNYDIGTPVNSTGKEERLLPRCEGSVYTLGDSSTDPYPVTVTGSLNISDGTTYVGDLDFSCTADADLGESASFWPSVIITAGIEFYYIRLRGNGTADVYFDATMIADNGATFDYELNETNTGYIPPGGSATFQTISQVTLSVLGVNVTGYIAIYDYLESRTPSAVDSFTFTYAIAVTTAYTYA